MFHSLFFHPGLHTPDALADTVRLVSAFKVEDDVQRTWREERGKGTPVG